MKQQIRRYYTEAEKAFMWDRWQKGDSMRDIGKLFGKYEFLFVLGQAKVRGAVQMVIKPGAIR